MKTIRLGIIGAGWVAEQHLKVMAAIGGIEPCGITCLTREHSEKVAGQYQIPVVADDLESLVKLSKPDALMVLVTEANMHQVTLQALKYQLPLFIEKPPGLLPQQTAELAEVATKKFIKTMVGFNRRFYSIFHKGIELIRKKGTLYGVQIEGHERFWKIRAAEKFSADIVDNWIYANSTHTIDLLRFFGEEVEDVKIITHAVHERQGDQFAAVAQLKNGAIGEYVSHWYSPGGWKVVLYGEGITVEFKPLEKGIWLDTKLEAHSIASDPVDVEHKAGFFRQMQAFGNLVRDGIQEWPAVNLAEAYKTMRLSEKFLINKHR